MKKVKAISYLILILSLALMLPTNAAYSVAPSIEEYPDLNNYLKPFPEPMAPGDIFMPPTSISAPIAGAPEIAEWSRTADLDESVVISAENLTETPSFIVYGQTTSWDGVLLDARIQSGNSAGDNRSAIITLPDSASGLPSWSVYMLWAGNTTGYSNPVLINSPETYWLGPDKGAVGDIVSLHGVNLAHDNIAGMGNSYIYLKPAGSDSEGQWAYVTNVNPYRVQFEIPSDLSNGTYEVWVHNGHGGQYGWAKSPNNLTIYDGPQWTATLFNVKDYGAVGDGVADDTNAIKVAIDACPVNSMATVYFPAGTYKVTSQLTMKSGTRWAGAGKYDTIIKPSGAYVYQIYASRLDTIELSDFTLDLMDVPPEPGRYENCHGINPARSNNVWLTSLSVTAPLMGCVMGDVWFDDSINQCSYVYLNDCDFDESMPLGVKMSRQVFFDNCHFKGKNQITNYDSAAAIYNHDCEEVSITNCTARDSENGVPQGTMLRFVCYGLYDGGVYNQYYADNQTIDVGPMPGTSDMNSGEQILFENQSTNTIVTGATETTVTVGSASTRPRYSAVYVSKGKGAGQIRRVASHNGTTITLETPWNVIPDSGSYVVLAALPVQIIMYNNQIDGKTDTYPSKTYGSNSGAINMFCGGMKSIIANNTITDTRYGIDLYGHAGCPSWIGEDAIAFNQIIGNSFENVQDAIVLLNAVQDSGNGVVSATNNNYPMLGNIVRGNDANNCDTVLATANNEPWRVDTTRSLQENIFEHNSGQNIITSAISLDVVRNDMKTNFFVYKNNISGAISAVDFHNRAIDHNSLFLGNIWPDFLTTYSGTSASGESKMVVPYKLLNLTADPGFSASFILPVQNMGTSILDWSGSSNAEWMKLSKNNGSLSAEDTDFIVITCDPSNLIAGASYTGIVTVSNESFDQIDESVIIRFTVPENVVAIGDALIPYEVINGVVVINSEKLTQEQQAELIKALTGGNVTINLKGYEAVDLYLEAGWFKNVDYSINIETAKGNFSVKTKTLWNNSGKQRMITIRDSLSLKNV